jgi:hypothetical protein
MKVLKSVSFLITIFTPFLILVIIFNGLIGFIYNKNINVVYILLLFLILFNIIGILRNNNIKCFLLHAKISLFSNYGITIISFFPILGILFMLPIYVTLILERFPNLLINYSDDIKLIFIFGIIILILLICHIIIISISFLYFSKYIKIIYKGEKNKIVKYCVLYFVPIINIRLV